MMQPSPRFIVPITIAGSIGVALGVAMIFLWQYTLIASIFVGVLSLAGFFLDKPVPMAEEKPKLSPGQQAFSPAMEEEIITGVTRFERQVQATVRAGKMFFALAGALISTQLAGEFAVLKVCAVPLGILCACIAIGHVAVLPWLSRKGEAFYREVNRKLKDSNARASVVAGIQNSRTESVNWGQYNTAARGPGQLPSAR